MAELDKVTKARVSITLTNPFFSSILLKRPIVEDKNIPTLCTDGKEIRYNKKFLESLTPEEIKGGFIHEVKHIILLHHLRRGNRDPFKWNLAADLAINPLIIDYGFKLPKGCLYEEEFKDMAAEQIYAKLPDPITIKISCSGGEGEEKGINGKGGKTYKQFDDVVTPKNPDGSELSEGQMKELEQEIKIDVQQAYQIAKKQGKVPAGLERFIKDFLEPKVNWREALAQFVVQRTRNDYSWVKPNKRYLQQGIYVPSLNKPELGEVVICVDTSGSIGQKELDEFTAEVKGILSCFCSKVYVIYCDYKVAHVDEFDEPNDIILKPHGGGGTSLAEPFRYMMEKGIEPIVAIYLTDGYADDYNKKIVTESPFDLIWCLSEKNESFKPKYGEVIVLK